MNNKDRGNGTLTGPLIFTIPASRFFVALNLNWFDVTDRTAEEKRRAYNATAATQRLDSATADAANQGSA